MKLLQALLALFSCAFLPLFAADLSDLTYTTTNGEVTIADCDTTASGELVIPDIIEGNPVTRIRDYAFRHCSSLTSITIPDSVTSIGLGGFHDCINLTSITIPDGVTSIGDWAFYNCTNLTNITIPDSVTSIGLGVFHDCTNLTNIKIPDSVTSIGDHTFDNCISLTSITIPEGVTSIGKGAFQSCSKLTSITIPEGVTSIGKGAFQSCISLTSITFMGAAPTVGDDVFSGVADGAEAPVSNEFVDSFRLIGNNWNGLTLDWILTWTTTNSEVTITDCKTNASGELVIPATIEGNPVTSIGADAFASCVRLTSITIPDSVTSIGTSAFWDCSSLTSIIFQGAAPTVGINAFSGVADGAEALVTIENQVSFGESCEKWNNLTVRSSEPPPQSLEVQLAQMTAERDAAIAERDARFTEDQIHAMSADSTIGMNDEGNVEIKINFFESADLVTFAPFTVAPESVSVVDGNICLEFTPKDAAFFRFRIE